MRFILWGAFFVVLGAFGSISASAQDPQRSDLFTLDFEWGDIPLCMTGRPNVVANPEFTFKNIPHGTKYLYLKLVDLDAPHYPHGDAWVEYKGENIIPSGLFEYQSPCPPRGIHRYQWIAITDDDRSLKNGHIALIVANKNYP